MLKGWLGRHTKKGAGGGKKYNRNEHGSKHQPGALTTKQEEETAMAAAAASTTTTPVAHPNTEDQEPNKMHQKIHQEKGKGDVWANIWPMLSGSPSDMKRSPSNAHVLPPSYSTCFHQQQVDMIFHLRAVLAKENAVRKQP